MGKFSCDKGGSMASFTGNGICSFMVPILLGKIDVLYLLQMSASGTFKLTQEYGLTVDVLVKVSLISGCAGSIPGC